MERLLYSSSPTPLKDQLKRSPFLPALPRFVSPSFSLSTRSRLECRRVSSISCESSGQSLPRYFTPIESSNFRLQSPSLVGSANDSIPDRKFVEQISSGDAEKRKVITRGVLVLISAVVAFFLNPFVARPAIAAFQTQSNSGGSAAAIVGSRFLRTELLSSAWTGFFAGCLHTLSGPDHLAALAPLSIGRTRMESAAVGALWGCGHDAGQVIFGLLFLLLKDRLHIEIIRTWGTRVVGLTLLVIGAMGIKEATEVPAPCVALENGDADVGTLPAERIASRTGPKKKIGFATFATGIVHGLQPDALMIVLPALALPSRTAGVAFLMMFLVGTVIAMGSYTVFIGSCSEALKDRVPRITEKLTWASSLVAIGLGLAIIISQFFGFSLY